MEHESIRNTELNDNDLEEGELSTSDDGYTPVARPEIPVEIQSVAATTSNIANMDDISDAEDFPSSESSDSDNFSTKKKKKPKIFALRLKPIEKLKQQHPKPNKFKIWSAGLQEEALMQNLQGCDVTNINKYSRDVESYDYSIKYRLNGENKLKRRQSYSDDSESNFDYDNKRTKGVENVFKKNKRSIKSRLGRKSDSSNSNSNDGNQLPRIILDLTVTIENTNAEIAMDIANKLCEEKDDLLMRAVNVLGKELPIKLFEETQQIESQGGMLVLNGMRRRTPGGIFLNLLKNHPEIRQEHRKVIFAEEKKISNKEIKSKRAKNRDMKVEELKKTLKIVDNDLPALKTRTELAMSHLKPEAPYSMSNPPPSPVDGNRENSSDYDTHNIQHMNVTSPEKANQKDQDINTYDDDFLDMNCDDMELF